MTSLRINSSTGGAHTCSGIINEHNHDCGKSFYLMINRGKFDVILN